MTVETVNITSGPYAGNDVADTFSYDFTVKIKTQLVVYQTDADGANSTLVLDSDYSVTGVGAEGGGTIVRTAGPLPAGYVWFIVSNYQSSQLTDFESQGAFYPDVHESAFDKLTYLILQIYRKLALSLHLPYYYIGNATAELPLPEADKFLRWNADATALVNSDGTVVTVNPLSFGSFTEMVSSPLAGLRQVWTSSYDSNFRGVGAASYIRTSVEGTAGETDGGSYFIDTEGFRWELLHDGTVYLEQFGVVDPSVTYSNNLQAAIDATGVTEVLSQLTTATFDKVAFINRDNVIVDLSNTLITYIGDYDVYADFGIGTDRSIGFINSRGVLGTDTTTVSSSIVDGTNILTLDDATDFAVGDYIQLNITYPRRVDEQVAKIIFKDGDDVTIDYTFGWIVSSCTITKIDAMRQNNHIKLKLYDNSPATVDANKIAGIGMVYSAMCSASWEVSNHNYPAYINYYCQDIQLSDGYASMPRDISSGRGYNAQTNNSNRVDAERLISRRCRHNWDSSGSSFCTVKDSHAYSPVDNISQYTTHGIYEHDIDFINCSQYDGQNSYSIAQSGLAFGSQNRRVNIKGGRCNGVIKAENAKQFTMEDVNFYGVQAVDHEFAATEGTVIRNVKFNTAGTIRITVPSDITGTDGIPSTAETIIFDNVDFNGNALRTTNVKGSIHFVNNCRNIGIMSDSDLVDYPYDIKFEDSTFSVATGWELKPTHNLSFVDNTITVVNSVSFRAGSTASIRGGELTSASSNIRLKLNAPVVIANGVTTKHSVGIYAEALCKNFNLTNISSIEPDAAHTSNQFTVEGTTDCTWMMTGMNVKYSGTGKSIFLTNATLKAMLTGSYVEGEILIGTIAQFIHANSNITPDTVLTGGSMALQKVVQVVTGTIASGVTGTLFTSPALAAGQTLNITDLRSDTATVQIGITLTVDGVNIFSAQPLIGTTPSAGEFGVSRNFSANTNLNRFFGVSNQQYGRQFVITKNAGNTAQDIFYRYEILEAV